MLTLLMCAITSCGDAERPQLRRSKLYPVLGYAHCTGRTEQRRSLDIPVAATEACSYDRTVAVEVIDKKSNAIEGKHYTIESNTITIKAGERAANVRIRGNYDAIAATDSLGLTLRCSTQQPTNGICMKRAMKPRLSCRNAVRSTSTSSTDMLC